MALTQKEIEELISSMMKEGTDDNELQVVKPRLRVYDFKRPDKFSKDHLRGVQLLFDNFCRLVTSYFSGLFRLAIHSNVLSVDQVTYEEFSTGLSNPCSVAVVDWESLSSNMLVNFSPQIALFMVDRLCGGPGTAMAVSRALTEIETAVLRRIAETMAQILSTTLREFNIEQHELSVASIEVNPLFVQQAMAPNDIVMSVTIGMKFGGQSGNIELCLPYTLLEPVLPALSAHRWFSKRDDESNEKNNESVSSAIQHVEIPISCRLGERALAMKDVMSLKPGDVIELDARTSDYAVLHLLGKPKFNVEIGRVGSRMAARIVSRREDNSEELI
ncbi:MAG TPA: flagellar motor switch protein FliM [Firmicutes bacterium]|nr:flagellar motor switch protein FliM [Candidatus Fermentithermobacillaceae bacterium]